jgi:hypothetical protein
MKTRHLPGSALLFLLALAVAGCGSKKSAPAQITGHVLYNGSPVTGGTLTFHTDHGVYAVGISTDGAYTAIDLPEGEAVVTVDTEALNPDKKKVDYDPKTAGSTGPKYGGGKGGGPKAAPPAGAKKQERSPAGVGAPQGEVGSYVKIPRTYADKTKSTLRATLQSGKQSQDFELKD